MQLASSYATNVMFSLLTSCSNLNQCLEIIALGETNKTVAFPFFISVSMKTLKYQRTIFLNNIG